ncbi:MAG: patatin [Winogradskyella sp.]|nr:patatin [Winogradskyella sp.]
MLSLGALTLYAQDTQTQKTGLVLSGGGAKGFAHIGVLKVIDSLNIKIDYIAGTSMGAVIGSLYAAGYSGKQLEEIFKQTDFSTLINDEFPRSSKSFYERENAEKYAISLPFDNFKISLPQALSKGQNVYNLLYQLMLPVNNVENFSDLPIPFFCMATNIETGNPVLLDRGNLAEAVTASAALPSLFEPVLLGNDILIDGGVTNNFPVTELRDKGMDVIVGVDVQDDLRDRTSLKSAPEILLQINNFRTIKAMSEKASLTDIYIKPDIDRFSVISFSQGESIINIGEKAAKVKNDALSKLNKKEEQPNENETFKLLDSLNIRSINIKGNKNYTRSYILGKLRLKGDDRVSLEQFNKGINNLAATNNFDTFRYQLVPTGRKDEFDFKGSVVESSTRTFLKLGVHYDDLYNSGVLANLTKKRLLFNNDIASLDLILGDNSRYNLDYFLDKGFYLSIGFKSRFNQFNKNINPSLALGLDSPLLDELNSIDIDLQDFTNQLFVQTLFRKDFALRIGAEHKHLKIISETLFSEDQQGDATFENTDYLGVFGSLKFDTYSNAYFPKNGFLFDGNFNLYLSASDFNEDFNEFSIAKARIGYAFSTSDRFAINIESEGGFKIGDDSTTTLGFALGGYANNFINNFISFYGYDFLSLTGNSFVKALFVMDYEVFKKHHIIFAANYANIENDIFQTGEWFTAPDFTGYALGYSIETFIGPLEAKYTYSPDNGGSYWFFNVGFWF